MSLSKKHFEELARIAALISNKEDQERVVNALCEFSIRENPNFSPLMFRSRVEELSFWNV